MEHRRIDDLASLNIDEALADFFQLLAPGMVGESLDHAMAARGYNGRVEGMMTVVVAAYLD